MHAHIVALATIAMASVALSAKNGPNSGVGQSNEPPLPDHLDVAAAGAERRRLREQRQRIKTHATLLRLHSTKDKLDIIQSGHKYLKEQKRLGVPPEDNDEFPGSTYFMKRFNLGGLTNDVHANQHRKHKAEENNFRAGEPLPQARMAKIEPFLADADAHNAEIKRLKASLRSKQKQPPAENSPDSSSGQTNERLSRRSDLAADGKAEASA